MALVAAKSCSSLKIDVALFLTTKHILKGLSTESNWAEALTGRAYSQRKLGPERKLGTEAIASNVLSVVDMLTQQNSMLN